MAFKLEDTAERDARARTYLAFMYPYFKPNPRRDYLLQHGKFTGNPELLARYNRRKRYKMELWWAMNTEPIQKPPQTWWERLFRNGKD